MLGLLYKDFKLQKIGIKGYLICLIVFFISADLADINIQSYIYRMLLPFIIYSYVIIGIAYDNTFRVEGVLVSLPVSKKEIVLSKYINILIAAVLGAISTFVIILAVSIKFNIEFTEFFSFKRLFLSIGGSAFIVGLLIPTYLKYGLIKGKVLTLVAMMIFVGSNMVFGIFDQIKLNIFSGDYAIIILIALFMVSLLVSYTISLKHYERREF